LLFSKLDLNPFEMASTQEELISKITKELENDAKVKVAAVDIDGVLRGKVMQKSKFFSILKDGFGKAYSSTYSFVISHSTWTLTCIVSLRILLGHIWMGYT
jgi:glutamine synthetase